MKGTGGTTGGADRGFSMVELLIVIVILGILASVAVFAVRGTTDNAQENGCELEHRALVSAAEAYMTRERRIDIEPTGVGPERYERTLADLDYFAEPSELYDIQADGTLVIPADSPCA